MRYYISKMDSIIVEVANEAGNNALKLPKVTGPAVEAKFFKSALVD